jgi:hypothetical protein
VDNQVAQVAGIGLGQVDDDHIHAVDGPARRQDRPVPAG